MHLPHFPPKIEEWFPGEIFRELPLPRWLIRSPELPPGVTYEQAVSVIAGGAWARGLAEGIARRGGLTPDTPEWRKFVDTFSRAVAEGMLRRIA